MPFVHIGRLLHGNHELATYVLDFLFTEESIIGHDVYLETIYHIPLHNMENKYVLIDIF